MLNNYKLLIMLLFSLCLFNTPANAARSRVKGDPDLLWLTPLGKSDIKNNAYNRCLLIRAVKPGSGKGGEAQRNAFDILSTYSSNLYAQAVKTWVNVEEEKAANNKKADDEKALIEKATRTLSDISRRLNIINSLEAGGVMVDSLMEIRSMGSTVYETFPAIVNGKYDSSATDCEVLK